MKKHFGNILPLFAATTILVAVSFLASSYPLSATTGPGETPPDGIVIPTFDGLMVKGDATVEEVLYVSEIESLSEFEDDAWDFFTITNPVNIGGTVTASSLLTSGSVKAGDTILAKAGIIDDSFHVKGNLSSGGSVGSFYTMQTDITTDNAVSAICKAGDYLTGCGGYSQGVLKYSYHTGNTCYARSTTLTRTIAKARCFDPQGETTGVNPL